MRQSKQNNAEGNYVKFTSSCHRTKKIKKQLPEFHCSSLGRYTQEECYDHDGSSGLTTLHSTVANFKEEKMNKLQVKILFFIHDELGPIAPSLKQNVYTTELNLRKIFKYLWQANVICFSHHTPLKPLYCIASQVHSTFKSRCFFTSLGCI